MASGNIVAEDGEDVKKAQQERSRLLLSDFSITKPRPSSGRMTSVQDSCGGTSRIGQAMTDEALESSGSSENEYSAEEGRSRRASRKAPTSDDDRAAEMDQYLNSQPPSPAAEESWGGSGFDMEERDRRKTARTGLKSGTSQKQRSGSRSAPSSTKKHSSAKRCSGAVDGADADSREKGDATQQNANSPWSRTLHATGTGFPGLATDIFASPAPLNTHEADDEVDPLAQFDMRRTSGSGSMSRSGDRLRRSSTTSHRNRAQSIADHRDGSHRGPLEKVTGSESLSRANSWGRAGTIGSIGSPKVRQGGISVADEEDRTDFFTSPTPPAAQKLKQKRASGGAVPPPPTSAKSASGPASIASSHRSSGGSANSHASVLSESHSSGASTSLTRPGSGLSTHDSIGVLSSSLLNAVSQHQQKEQQQVRQSIAAAEGDVTTVYHGSAQGSNTTSVDTLSETPQLNEPPILSPPRHDNLRSNVAVTPSHTGSHRGSASAVEPRGGAVLSPSGSSDFARSPGTSAASLTPLANRGLGLGEAVNLTMSPNTATHREEAPVTKPAFGLSRSPAPPSGGMATARQAYFDRRGTSLVDPPQPQTAGPLTSSFSTDFPPCTPGSATSPVTGAFDEHVQRRHTGVFLSRTRSQALQNPDMSSAFSSRGGGRAAARARAMQPINYDNAPFSVLEARARAGALGALSVPPSPGGFTATALASPGWLAALQAKAAAPMLSPSTLTHPTEPKAEQAGSSEAQALASPAWLAQDYGFTSLSSLSDIADLMPPAALSQLSVSSGSPAPEDLDHRPVAEEVVDMLEQQAASLSTSPTGSDGTGPRPSIVTTTNSGRPGMSRSLTAFNPTRPMLRTPTTKEWSQFLAEQGVDPNLPRSRTATGSSRLAGRPLQMSTPEVEEEPGSSSDSDDSDGAGDGLLERLHRHLSTNRIGPLSNILDGNASSPVVGLHRPAYSESSTGRKSPFPAASSPRKASFDGPALELTPDRSGKLSQGSARASPARIIRPEKTVAPQPLTAYTAPPSGYQRSIEDFGLISDVGRGAYGLVKKAKLKDANGQPSGGEYIIKFIIKSRILADCWRRHRVLGPIPIEIHVMDQLRRLPYVPPKDVPAWAPERLFPGTPAMAAAISTQDDQPRIHPNLAHMVDFFEDHEFYYLVMPCFGRGQDLFDFVEGAPDGLDARHVRCICGQVADGLRYLHAHNIVHRDIKDENVILDGKGHAQIIDFGSAAHIKPGRLFDTFSGTLDYAAAEILQGEKYGGKEQDVWAFGVVLYVLMCGECPFWNGEEAVAGLVPGSRAALALQERCMMGDVVRDGEGAVDDGLGDTDEQLTRHTTTQREWGDKGQPDGGGKLSDAADLIQQCLSLQPSDRPTADEICQHRFLVGHRGWRGSRGWEPAP